MLTVVITEKGGEQRRMDFDQSEVTIGRVQGNDIILPRGNVSKRHSRIVLKDGKYIIVDLKSTNGTYVNGRKISSPLVIKPTDKIYIGDFILAVEDSGADAAASDDAPSAPSQPPRKPAPPASPKRPPADLAATRTPDDVDDVDEEGEEEESMPPPPPPIAVRRAPEPADDEEEDLEEEESIPAGREVPVSLSSSGSRGRPDPTPASLSTRPPSGSTRQAPSYPPTRDPSGPGSARKPPDIDGSAKAARAATLLGSSTGPAAAAARAPAPVAAPPPPPLASKVSSAAKARNKEAAPSAPSDGSLASAAARVHERLEAFLDPSKMDFVKLANGEFRDKTERVICDIVEQMRSDGDIASSLDLDPLVELVLREALGYGPLEELLADSDVRKILVNRPGEIFVEKGGRLTRVDRAFSSDRVLAHVVERMVGQRAQNGTSVLEGRMPDGAHVVAVMPPAAVGGPSVTISRSAREAASLDALVKEGVMSEGMAEFFDLVLRSRENMVVGSSTRGGASALLSAFGSAAPAEERVISVDEDGELVLKRGHWVQLEARPPHAPMRELVRSALRMRPDRLVIGEIRGGEAFDLVQSMSVGSEGTLAGVHASSGRDAMGRIEGLMQLAGTGAPQQLLHELLVQAVTIVVHVARFADGKRRITQVVEMGGVSEEGEYELNLIFAWKPEGGPDEEGNARGRFVPSEFVPRFCEDLGRRGIKVNPALFKG